MTPITTEQAAWPITNEQAAWEAFDEHTREHELAVIHDDGLYRHLRLAKPGTRMWSIDITTWPGHLATTGDIGSGFIFARTADMIDFFASRGDFRTGFGAPSIDFRYWEEKLCGRGTNKVYEYSPNAFVKQVESAVDDFIDGGGDPGEANTAELLVEARRSADDEDSAHDFISLHDEIFGPDSWELNFTEISFQFGLACYAIDRVVTDYLAGRYTRVEP